MVDRSPRISYYTGMIRARPPQRMLKLVTAILFTSAATMLNAAPDDGAVALRMPSRIRVSERSNLSVSEDGRYVGLFTREVSGYASQRDRGEYSGRFFVYEKLRRDAHEVGRLIDRSTTGTLRFSSNTLFHGDAPYPYLQDFLALPRGPIAPGAAWEGSAWILVNPRRAEVPLRLPVTVLYEYRGRETWNGVTAARIEARFATRYPLPPSDDPDAPVVDYSGDLTLVQGAHHVTVMLLDSGTQLAFLRDTVHERYRFADGSTMEVRGHVLIFLSGGDPAAPRISAAIEERLGPDRARDVSVDRTDVGVRLTIEALRFLPDQAVLLPDEGPRLSGIAGALAPLQGVRFLVVGHTADVGTAESQEALSVERARIIAEELARRGISRDAIDIEGRGGTEPVAANETEAGRSRNRRVEIYVLEE